MKLSKYVRKIGSSGRSALISGSCGTFNSSTIIVMMMAKTPSLNASSRFVFMRRTKMHETDDELPAFPRRKTEEQGQTSSISVSAEPADLARFIACPAVD